MNEMMRKSVKKSLAILLAVILVVTLGYFFAKDSRLHAEEEFGYYGEPAEAEPEYEPGEEGFEPDALEDISFSDEMEEVAEVEEAEAAETEEYEFPDISSMGEDELNEYLAGLSEEELEALEKQFAEEDEYEEEEAEDAEPLKLVFIDAEYEKPLGIGSEIKLIARTVGFDNLKIQYRWLCDKGDGEGYKVVPDANESTFTFIVDEENMNWNWNLAVDVIESDPVAEDAEQVSEADTKAEPEETTESAVTEE